jgi:hypothetical protein
VGKVFHRKRGILECVVICFVTYRGGFFHILGGLSKNDVENFLKIVEKCGIL